MAAGVAVFGSPTRLNTERDGVVSQRGVLVRESLTESDKGTYEPAYYLTSAPVETPLAKLVEIVGCRWAASFRLDSEECFEQAKQQTGLDESEVRSWDGGHRHITLSMQAHATLAVIRAKANARQQDTKRPASRKRPKRANRKPR